MYVKPDMRFVTQTQAVENGQFLTHFQPDLRPHIKYLRVRRKTYIYFSIKTTLQEFSSLLV